jgi:Leucine-rich repeat (LRR) protein
MKKHYVFLLLVITILLSKTTTTKAQVDVNDSLALVDLYNSTDGPNWVNNTNWLTEKPVSDWYGIYLTGNRVTIIYITSNGLKGTLPSSLGNLTNLYWLSLIANQLSGSIPPQLGNLTDLIYVYLGNNQLSGSIPSELGKLVNLNELRLEYNQLSGNIPPEFGNLSNIQILLLNNNQSSGSIPPELGNLQNLSYLNLSYNQLNGNIPSELGNLRCWYLDLKNNQLSGNIPSELGNLSHEYLYLNNNQLSGNIPPQLGKNTNLNELYLNNNQLSGSIPLELGKLTRLTQLDLSNNQLSGSIPSSLGNLFHLDYVDLSHNKLTGNVPLLRNFKNLKKINIADNDLINTRNSVHAQMLATRSADIWNNHFTFDGIEVLLQHDFKTLVYTPQKNIPLHQNNNMLSVYAGGTLSNNTYKWFKDGSLVTTNIGDSAFTPTQSGAYTVEVTNSIATELTLYSDTVTFSAARGIQQNNIADKINFSVYPNPATTMVAIAFNATGNSTIQLTDVSGKILHTKTVTAIKGKNLMQLDVSKYGAGVYFVTISNEKNETQTLRLNKE